MLCTGFSIHYLKIADRLASIPYMYLHWYRCVYTYSTTYYWMYFCECLKFHFTRRGNPNLTYWNIFDRKKITHFYCKRLRESTNKSFANAINTNKNKLFESWRKVPKEIWQGTEKMQPMEQFIHIMKDERMPKLQDLALKRQDFQKIPSKVQSIFSQFHDIFDNLTCRFKNDKLIIFANVTFQRRFDQSYCK